MHDWPRRGGDGGRGPCPAARSGGQTQVAKKVAEVEQVPRAVPLRRTGRRWRRSRCRRGTKDAKFGIFIHWGVVLGPGLRDRVVPARTCTSRVRPDVRAPRGDLRAAHGVRVQGLHPAVHGGAPSTRTEWVVAVPDGPARSSSFRWPSTTTDSRCTTADSTRWNAAEMGPERDVIGELAAAAPSDVSRWSSACRATGPSTGGLRARWDRFPSDVTDPANRRSLRSGHRQASRRSRCRPNDEFLDDWLVRYGELVDKYEPQLVWFDWWIENEVFEPVPSGVRGVLLQPGAEWKPGVAINYKIR